MACSTPGRPVPATAASAVAPEAAPPTRPGAWSASGPSFSWPRARARTPSSPAGPRPAHARRGVPVRAPPAGRARTEGHSGRGGRLGATGGTPATLGKQPPVAGPGAPVPPPSGILGGPGGPRRPHRRCSSGQHGYPERRCPPATPGPARLDPGPLLTLGAAHGTPAARAAGIRAPVPRTGPADRDGPARGAPRHGGARRPDLRRQGLCVLPVDAARLLRTSLDFERYRRSASPASGQPVVSGRSPDTLYTWSSVTGLGRSSKHYLAVAITREADVPGAGSSAGTSPAGSSAGPTRTRRPSPASTARGPRSPGEDGTVAVHYHLMAVPVTDVPTAWSACCSGASSRPRASSSRPLPGRRLAALGRS